MALTQLDDTVTTPQTQRCPLPFVFGRGVAIEGVFL